MQMNGGIDMKQKLKFLVDYITLVLYSICMYILWKLCKFGGTYYWLRIMLPFVILLIILLLVRLILRHRGYRASYFKFRLVLFIAISLVFGGMIVHTAIPYNGALSWKIDDFLNHKKIKFIHNNIYENGIDGLINDIGEKNSLPEKIYVSDDFYIEFTEDGTITNIETMLYGENDKGQLKGFLITYDCKKDSKINIWLNEGEGLSINSDKLLNPFFAILKQSDYKEQVHNWEDIKQNQTYSFLYSGKEKVNSEKGLSILDGDADGDGKYNTGLTTSMLSRGGEFSGYMASLYIKNNEDISSFKYLMEPQYISPEILENEHNSEIIEDAKSSKRWITDENNGTVYTFVLDDKKIGYRLVVVDAAAGSRFYEFEKSIDSGENWKVINKDPFMDEAGSAEGIIFFSNDFGFIGIQGASGQYSQIYSTKDGGLTFRQVNLPMDKVKDIPKEGKEIGLKLDDYKYLSMPESKGNKLYITVTTGEYESNGIQFYSEDAGESWNVLTK